VLLYNGAPYWRPCSPRSSSARCRQRQLPLHQDELTGSSHDADAAALVSAATSGERGARRLDPSSLRLLVAWARHGHDTPGAGRSVTRPSSPTVAATARPGSRVGLRPALHVHRWHTGKQRASSGTCPALRSMSAGLLSRLDVARARDGRRPGGDLASARARGVPCGLSACADARDRPVQQHGHAYAGGRVVLTKPGGLDRGTCGSWWPRARPYLVVAGNAVCQRWSTSCSRPRPPAAHDLSSLGSVTSSGTVLTTGSSVPARARDGHDHRRDRVERGGPFASRSPRRSPTAVRSTRWRDAGALPRPAGVVPGTVRVGTLAFGARSRPVYKDGGEESALPRRRRPVHDAGGSRRSRRRAIRFPRGGGREQYRRGTIPA